VVYRPLAISTKRVKGYCSHYYLTNNLSIKEVTYRDSLNYKYSFFDRIKINHFFTDRNWDMVKYRNLHRYVRIMPSKYISERWEDQANPRTRFSRRENRNTLSEKLVKVMLRDMFEDMFSNNNRVVFPCLWKGQVFGWYKIGFFNEWKPNEFRNRSIFAIVPHEREVIGKWYPVISCPLSTWRYIESKCKLNKHKHEDIDVQERIAAHLRLNRLGRHIHAST